MICITADAPNPSEKRDSFLTVNRQVIMKTFPQTIPQASTHKRTNDLTPKIMNEAMMDDWIDDMLNDESFDDIVDFDALIVESMDEEPVVDFP